MTLLPMPPQTTAGKLSTVLLSTIANNWVLPMATSIKKINREKELKKVLRDNLFF